MSRARCSEWLFSNYHRKVSNKCFRSILLEKANLSEHIPGFNFEIQIKWRGGAKTTLRNPGRSLWTHLWSWRFKIDLLSKTLERVTVHWSDGSPQMTMEWEKGAIDYGIENSDFPVGFELPLNILNLFSLITANRYYILRGEVYLDLYSLLQLYFHLTTLSLFPPTWTCSHQTYPFERELVHDSE